LSGNGLSCRRLNGGWLSGGRLLLVAWLRRHWLLLVAWLHYSGLIWWRLFILFLARRYENDS